MEILGDFQTSVERALTEIDSKWRNYPGLIICGSHSPHDTERYIDLIRSARISGLPFLGICWGFQLAAIEFARNILGIADATSEEWDKRGTFVVKKRQELKVGLHEGETWWSNYEVDVPGWERPINFFLSPAHPEYQSALKKPHPLLKDFIQYARK